MAAVAAARGWSFSERRCLSFFCPSWRLLYVPFPLLFVVSQLGRVYELPSCRGHLLCSGKQSSLLCGRPIDRSPPLVVPHMPWNKKAVESVPLCREECVVCMQSSCRLAHALATGLYLARALSRSQSCSRVVETVVTNVVSISIPVAQGKKSKQETASQVHDRLHGPSG